MDDQVTAYQDLGEAVLEEVLVRAGIDQAHAPQGDEIRLAINFVVSVDAERDQLLIRGERIGQSPFALRLGLSEAPAEWRVPKKNPPGPRP